MGKITRYQLLYDHYRREIEEGRIRPGARLLSVRDCAALHHCSRTTVESAYSLLAADGYLVARPQSGYYAAIRQAPEALPAPSAKKLPSAVRYDFTSHGSEPDPSTFALWARYVKSALRKTGRLSHYGDPQGEPDLRQALADYVRHQRNILCSPDQIVIGAGLQSLLFLLCPLLPHPVNVSFPAGSFRQAITVFEAFGNHPVIKDPDAPVIYVSPAHMTRWGTAMPASRREQLAARVREHDSILIEDDYENEFVTHLRKTPSLYSLAGGSHVVYISSFSRILLPSVRISFMILPEPLLSAYRTVASFYNQTASVAEQIALASYIRDGHLATRIRKLSRTYAERRACMIRELKKAFPPPAELLTGDGGFAAALLLPLEGNLTRFAQALDRSGIRCVQEDAGDGRLRPILSCASLPEAEIPAACQALADAAAPFL